MKKLKYVINFECAGDQAAGLNQLGQKKVFENFLSEGINQLYKEGLDNRQLRKLNGILNALDISQDDYIILEDEHFEFLKYCFTSDKIKYRAAATRLLIQYLDNIGNAGNA